ncbi:hypothetical protein GF324_09515 [bacterium]|nr:hypothetical protein [bacterium]
MTMPNRFLSPKWIVAVLLALVVWAVVTHLALLQWGPVSLIYTGAAAMLAFALLGIELLLRLVHLKTRTYTDYFQLQSVVSLYHTLQPPYPLFQMRKWGLGPDTATHYMYHIAREKPKVVVELGSGTSTVIAGLALKQIDAGRVYALDDDSYWTSQSEEMLRLHSLEANAEVRHAPMKEIEFQGERRHYYDLSVLDDLSSIDMLLVDGPHDMKDTLNRLPGLYLLADRLSDRATVFVDDTVRPNWRREAKRWAKENGFSMFEPKQNEHGLLILQRNESSKK